MLMYLRKLTTAAAAAIVTMMSLNSCQLEPYELPATELYTRSFIKEFGLIDPNQDWNMAKEANVTINVGSHANAVKVYCKLGEKYYLVADLIDIAGTVTVPVDIPESTTDLKVTIDGKVYYTTPGGSVNACAPASRAVNPSNATYTTADSKSITVAVGNATGEQQYFKFNAQQMGPILAPVTYKDYAGGDIDGHAGEKYYWPDYYSITPGATGMQENPDTSPGGRVPESNIIGDPNPNLLKSGIYQDFTLTLDKTSFIIYPMYWFTDQTHTIGIYFIDDEGNPVKDASDKIIQVPVYTSKGANDIEWYRQGATPAPKIYGQVEYKNMPQDLKDKCPSEYASGDNDGDGINDNFIAEFKKWYTNSYSTTAMMYSSNDEFAYPSVWTLNPLPSPTMYEITSIKQKKTEPATLWMEITFTVKSDSYPDGYPEALKEINGTWVGYAQNLENFWKSHSHGSYAFKNEALMRSQGIEVDISGWSGKLGMYTTFGAITLYSQKN